MSQEANATIECPVCRGVNYRSLFPKFAHPDQAEGFHFCPGSYCLCLTCGVIRTLPVSLPENIEDFGKSYYDQMTVDEASFQSISAHAMLQKKHYEGLRQKLLSRYPADRYRKWLDVGSAGSPTIFADYQFTTIEPDPRAVHVGRQLFHPERIHCSIVEAYQTQEKFDGVTFMNSFYCTPTPAAALDAAHRLLRDDGILLIAIAGSIMGAADWGADGQCMRVEDLFRGDALYNYFNPANLSALCSQHGFVSEGSEVVTFSELGPFHSVRFNYFRKVPQCADLTDVRESFAKGLADTEAVLESRLQGYEVSIRETLTLIDRQDVAVVTTSALFHELSCFRPLTSAMVLLDANEKGSAAGAIINGVEIRNAADLVESIKRGLVRHVVILTFDGKRDLALTLFRAFGQAGVNLYMPSRNSGINAFNGSFDGKWRPVKGLQLCRLGPSPDGALAITPAPVRELRDAALGAA